MDTELQNARTERSRLHFYIWTGLFIWTAALMLSMYLSLSRSNDDMLKVARIQARSAIDRDILFRHWNAMLGGVYSKVTPALRPNPYLKVPERDITTDDGTHYTLINPSYMTRQIHELGSRKGLKGHLTSLHPVRPGNTPDTWERMGLLSFEKKPAEVSSVETIDGAKFLRLMKPMIAEASCLKCHTAQHLKVGDVLGGLSVSVPMQPLLEIRAEQVRSSVMWHGVIWVLGLFGWGYSAKKLFVQIRRRRKAQEIIQQQALHDQLTGLPNRRFFFEQLKRDLARTARESSCLALLYIDLDGFKAINDNHGHGIGDGLLQAVSEIMVECIREEDMLARFGGDEFCVILPHLESREGAIAVAERIIDSLRTPVDVHGYSCDIGASIGVAISCEGKETSDVLLHRADCAMYAVKQGGKNAVNIDCED